MMSVVIGSCFAVNWRMAGVSQWFDLCVRDQNAKCDKESLHLRLSTKTKKNCPLIDNNQTEILESPVRVTTNTLVFVVERI